MIIKSFAKINVSLLVKGLRDDGYHQLEMVTLPIELHDIIEIQTSPYFYTTFVTCDDVALSKVHHNLCAKAVEALRKVYGFKDNFNIHIHKEIPFAAGLGGGSSNAAAILLTLNNLLHLRASLDELNTIGASIGADVPFFLHNRPALVTGIGENNQPINVKKSYNCLIVKPTTGLSTKEVFSHVDEFPCGEGNTAGVIEALEKGDDELLANSIHNDLYRPACLLLPEVEEVVSSLKNDGFPVVSMTGSGSCVFALSDNPKKCKEYAKKYEKLGYVVALTRTMR